MSSAQNQNDNPIQEEYEEKFNDLRDAEKSGTTDGSGDSASIKDAEDNPNNSWKSNSTGAGGIHGGKNTSSALGNKWKNSVTGSHTGPQKASLKYSMKKKGPLTAIILTLVGGGVGVTAFLSPSILLVQFKEIMVNKFNTQLSSMDVRTTRMLTNKMKTIKGVCTSAVSVRCKYSTMSKRQIEKFEKAGIKVNYDEKNLAGRAKPTSFEFNGKKIDAKNFNKTIKNSPEFRVALKRAYNPKFSGFADAIWNKTAAKLGITKTKAKIDGDTDEERLKSIQENTKNPQTGDSVPDQVSEGDQKPGTSGDSESDFYTADEAEDFNRAARNASNAANELGEAASGAAAKGVKVAPSVLAGVTNTVKLTGWVDNACVAYSTVRAVGFAAKTVRALQLARYAMIFLNVADQIKAGTANSKDVAYLSKIMTKEVAASATSVKLGTATNSFGYRYAAYGERGKMSDTASQFLAGGGLTGKFIGVTSLIDSTIRNSTGMSPKKACKILGNPFVSAGSFIAGIGLMFIPGANVAFGAKMVAQAAAGVAIQVAVAFLPGLLQDIVAGVLVDKNTVGEAAGEAVTSGSSGIMSTVANAGGNAPLTPKQAVAYSNLSSEIAAQYAEEDRLTHSPFDASNSNTFLGKIATALLPYASSTSSPSSVLGSVASIATGSFGMLTPRVAQAASTDEYTMCQDYDYRDMNLATDPYCNVTYGIPADALEMDPLEVIDALGDQIDPETGDPASGSQYEDFVKDCIDRKTPLGDDSDGSDGSKCMFDAKPMNKYYYVHYIDQRVQAGLDGAEVVAQSTTGTDSGETSGDGTEPPSGTARPDNVLTVGRGWVLKDGVDYSNIRCADGTTDGGKYKHPTRKFTIRTCHTSLSTDNSSNEVASLISKKFVEMSRAAKKDHIDLRGSGWRSYEEQQALWAPCAAWRCDGMVAQPGNSNHEKGLAIDFTLNGSRLISSDKVHLWLDKHGAKFGFINLSYEPWHWSMSGG
jgi:LAS superfamily LD-carboxypeptidase LdcB